MHYSLLTTKDVSRITGLKTWNICHKSRVGTFPEPIRINGKGGTLRWKMADIAAWCETNGQKILIDLSEFEIVYEVKPEKVRAPSTIGRMEPVLYGKDPFTQETIASQSMPVDPSKEVCGIYFLLENSIITYVGQTKRWVFTRISSHAADKKFDSYHFIKCPPELLDLLETYYIIKFQPRDNSSNYVGFRTVKPYGLLFTEEFAQQFDAWLAERGA